VRRRTPNGLRKIRSRRRRARGDNESVLKRAVTPQVAPIYGGDFPFDAVFFIQDDHDYFDNDEATDDIITMPPSHFMLSMARATQRMY